MAFCFFLSVLSFTAAREITFPPIAGISQQTILSHSGIEGQIDVTANSEFVGLTTYANLPYVHCLAPKGKEVERYDIAILGAPFDTVSLISFLVLSVVARRDVETNFSACLHLNMIEGDLENLGGYRSKRITLYLQEPMMSTKSTRLSSSMMCPLSP